MFGVDYAWGDPGISALKQAGVKFVCRYVSTIGNSKNIRPEEAKKLLKAGIDLVLVFETTAGRALKGYEAGVYDAKSGRAQAEAAGAPTDAPLYFAVDFDASPDEQHTINQYLKGAGDVLGPDKVGVYGGYWVVKRCLDAKVCKYAWQTYAWSGGRLDSRAHIYQYSNGHRLNGVSVDYNRSLKSDFGAWPRGPKVKKIKPFWAWLRYFLDEKADPGYVPPAKIPASWWKRAAIFLKARKR